MWVEVKASSSRMWTKLCLHLAAHLAAYNVLDSVIWAHRTVVKFRFLDYPSSINQGNHSHYFIRVDLDNGLYTVASRLGVTLYDIAGVEKEKLELKGLETEKTLLESSKNFSDFLTLDSNKEEILFSAQKYRQKQAYMNQLEKWSLKLGQVIAVANDFGTVSLPAVRDTFKNPIYVGLYTIFVLAACFHGFNGLWTF